MGKHLGRQPLHATRVWRNGGITSRGQNLLFSPVVARGKSVWKPPPRQYAGTLAAIWGDSASKES